MDWQDVSKAYLVFVHKAVTLVGIIAIVVGKAEGSGWFQMAKAIRRMLHVPPLVRVLVEGQSLTAHFPGIHNVPA